jgi:hypothetical protein
LSFFFFGSLTLSFIGSPKGYETISSQTFQNALPTKIIVISLEITLGNKVGSMAFG